MVTGVTIPDATGVFHGCYQQHRGNLRLVSAGPCRWDEIAVQWN